MVKLCLGDKIDPIALEHAHEGELVEGADPHFWVSLKSAKIMASSIKDLISELNPSGKTKYQSNYNALIQEIDKADNEADSLFSEYRGRSFMIYHPNLAYLARDYGLKEIAVEFEGKENIRFSYDGELIFQNNAEKCGRYLMVNHTQT
jgi:ABC-type Zn uptake system ZnuABC Zn-binding protein ZnuA